MTINEAIARSDELRLNALEPRQKAAWLEELEGQLEEWIRPGTRGLTTERSGRIAGLQGRQTACEVGGVRSPSDHPDVQLDSPGDKEQGQGGCWPEEDPVLLLSGPYEELYVLYLICKIDYYNQDLELCANDMTQYNQVMSEARAWWRRNHRPRNTGNWEVGLP